ncbi:MAG: protein-L-isoaspartate(D-aspartate) O-methyltransferase [Myxococcota bacterium]|nr:protein-L-isoaspartate(D-aspartate) O-methyltransferase [Myxococcota bacterium]
MALADPVAGCRCGAQDGAARTIPASANEATGADAAPSGAAAAGTPASLDEPDRFRVLRAAMVSEQIAARGVSDPAVLRAMGRVQRHRFVPTGQMPFAYDDTPLPIGQGQTISQPYIVAVMTEMARVSPGDKVLEIGAGSGYQAAILAEVGARVFTIEIVPALAASARALLESLGYAGRITVREGDGYRGWPEEAPFDAIVVTAAPPEVPPPLVEQLAPGGRLVAPVGDLLQDLIVIEKATDGSVARRSVLPVRFVPMTGEAQR